MEVLENYNISLPYNIHHMSCRKIIDLDVEQPVRQPKKQIKPPAMWISSLNLSQKDKEVLLSPTAWITDSIVNAAQQLLREQFPQLPGLQDVSLGLTVAFNIMPAEFLQVLHTSQDHWVTISTIGVKDPKVLIYDSLYDYLPNLAKAQIASLLCSKEDVIKVQMMDVMLQV